MPNLTTRGAATAAGFGLNVGQAAGPIVEPNVGDAYGGGYYIGRIKVGANEYRLIVAPKAQGEKANGLVQFDGQTIPPNLTMNDGYFNTRAFPNDLTTYPATTWARQLVINGFADWYIPSRNEAEIMYRVMKPTTDANFTGARNNMAGEVGTFANGVNPDSVPPGAAYTTTNPPQSAIAIFRAGGGQDISQAGAFTTFGISNMANTQNGGLTYVLTGQQGISGSAVLGCMQRAIRREKV